ncbi:hypothetical protein CWI80_06905 [Pseudidiomarina sediminum]|uniref:TraB/GumN family protein n=1 Tax=Pseudidiomarina sediminum TaxID=431675 RepID=A0A432ZAW2_9GAMM|nr:DUF5694 domain-containing protein [Pseudidiomarina sediminum]RUO75049.1 hypothetical protein CWI80_06905 [Pseudidiomarina sediminum]
MIRILVVGLTLLFTKVAVADDAIAQLSERVKMKTQVMVLGSAHLSTIKEPLAADALQEVLEPLARFKPTAIGVETLRPEDIIAMQHGSEAYHPILQQFVGTRLQTLAEQQQQTLAVTASQALAAMHELLAEQSLDSAKRIQLLQYAIAGYATDTAALQWHYLQRQAPQDSLSSELVDYLNRLTSTNNERNSVAAALAQRLQLNRIYPIDDHLDKDMYAPVVERLMPSYMASEYMKTLQASDYISKPEQLKQTGLERGEWLPLFQWLNSEAYQQQVINTDWTAFVDKDLDPESALARFALWEVRNLNMTSNIMRVVTEHIGGRVVIVVGANHKVFLERYLANMIAVELVQFNDLIAKE